MIDKKSCKIHSPSELPTPLRNKDKKNTVTPHWNHSANLKAKFRGILAKDGADSIHEERQIRYAPQLSTEAFEFGVE